MFFFSNPVTPFTILPLVSFCISEAYRQGRGSCILENFPLNRERKRLQNLKKAHSLCHGKIVTDAAFVVVRYLSAALNVVEKFVLVLRDKITVFRTSIDMMGY